MCQLRNNLGPLWALRLAVGLCRPTCRPRRCMEPIRLDLRLRQRGGGCKRLAPGILVLPSRSRRSALAARSRPSRLAREWRHVRLCVRSSAPASAPWHSRRLPQFCFPQLCAVRGASPQFRGLFALRGRPKAGGPRPRLSGAALLPPCLPPRGRGWALVALVPSPVAV